MNRYKISLRITHPSMQSDEITKSLELAPTLSYTAGDRKVTPKGTEVPGRRRESYWCYDLPTNDDAIEYEIERCNAALGGKRAALEHITDGGGRVQYFVGWFSSGNSGFTLPHRVSRQLADLRIDLSLDLYTSEGETGE